MKKQEFAEERVKNLKVLSGMNIDLKTKRKLKKEAKNWLKYIKIHSSSIDHLFNNLYHEGEMSFIKLFFFSKKS